MNSEFPGEKSANNKARLFFLPFVTSEFRFQNVTGRLRIRNLDKFNLVMDGGLVLGSSKFLIVPQLPQKILLNSKVVKSDSKIISSLCLPKVLSKTLTHSVATRYN